MRRQPEQELADPASEPPGAQKATGDAHDQQDDNVLRDQPQDAARLGSECHADADFPGPPRDGVMEIRIALARLGPLRRAGQMFGLALDVTDTQTSWAFWPRASEIARPS
jgi:hypothetical protein